MLILVILVALVLRLWYLKMYTRGGCHDAHALKSFRHASCEFKPPPDKKTEVCSRLVGREKSLHCSRRDKHFEI